jgi:UrcA family protein
MKLPLSAALAACATVLGAGAAEAQEVRVQTYTTDFADPASVMQLHDTIAAGARTACREQGILTAGTYAERRACIVAAVDDAIAQVGRPSLSAAHMAIPQRRRYADHHRMTPAILEAVAAAEHMRAEADAVTTVADATIDR